MNRIHIAPNGYIVISFAFYVAAVLYLLFPHLPPLAICIFSGTLLISYGIIKIIGYFSEDLFCLAFRYDFAFGLLLLAMGAVVLIQRPSDILYLSAGIGWLALLDCFLKVQMSEEAKKFGLRAWNVIMATAIITGVLGMALIFKSCVKPNHTQILTSLTLLSIGIMNRCVIKFAVKDPRKQQSLVENQQQKNLDKGELS